MFCCFTLARVSHYRQTLNYCIFSVVATLEISEKLDIDNKLMINMNMLPVFIFVVK